MLSFVSPIVAIAILSATLVAGAPFVGGNLNLPTSIGDDGTFAVSQVHNSKHVANGPLALSSALKKFGVDLTDEIVSAMSAKGKNTVAGTAGAANAQSSVIAIPEIYDKEYLSPISIGSPPQTVNVDFDTGSADLWVFSTETAATDVKGQLLYNPKNSTTASLMNGSTWDITYGDGSGSSGNVYTDKVKIGAITVVGQAVESASTVSDSFTSDAASSGLLGLGFSSINMITPIKQKTWFENAMAALQAPLFTVNLKKGAVGNYNFGYISESEYTGSIGYADITSANGFWEFNMTAITVGTNSTNGTNLQGPFAAIADTGTSLILVDDSIVTAYYGQVEGATYNTYQAGYLYPCNVILPAFSFHAGDATIIVPGSYMNYAQVSTTPVSTNGTCYGGIQSNMGLGFAILGDVMLKSQFVVFDAGNARLGFASKDLGL